MKHNWSDEELVEHWMLAEKEKQHLTQRTDQGLGASRTARVIWPFYSHGRPLS